MIGEIVRFYATSIVVRMLTLTGVLKALKFETIVPTYDSKQVGEKYQQILTAFDV